MWPILIMGISTIGFFAGAIWLGIRYDRDIAVKKGTTGIEEPGISIIANCETQMLPTRYPESGRLRFIAIDKVGVDSATLKTISITTGERMAPAGSSIEQSAWLNEIGSVTTSVCDFTTTDNLTLFDVEISFHFRVRNTIVDEHRATSKANDYIHETQKSYQIQRLSAAPHQVFLLNRSPYFIDVEVSNAEITGAQSKGRVNIKQSQTRHITLIPNLGPPKIPEFDFAEGVAVERQRPHPLELIGEELVSIMETYDQQMAERGYVDTPGGLEHMGDVWRLLARWRNLLLDKPTT